MGIKPIFKLFLSGLALTLGSAVLAQSSTDTNKFGVPAVTTSEPQPVSEDGITPIGTGEDERKPGRTFTSQYDLSVGVTATDNISRAFNQNDQAGTFLTISPSYTAKLQTKRSWADFFIGLDYETVFPSGSGPQQRADAVGGRLNLASDLSLAGDAFRLATSADISRASDLLSGAGTTNTVTNRFLDEDSTSFGISPYSRGELGASNQYELRWQSRYLDPAGIVPHSVRHRLIGDFGTNPQATSTIGWNARIAGGTTRIDDGTQFDQLLSEFTVSALLANSFRLGVGVNYVQVDRIFDNAGNDSGVGPSVFFEWRPARATRLRARYARAYFGNLIDASLTRATTNWAMRLAYREGFEERNALAAISTLDLRDAFSIDRADLFSTNTVVRALQSRGVSLAYGTELEGNLVAQIQSPIIFDKTLTFSTGYLWPRSELLATLYASQINGAIAQAGVGFERVSRFGATVTYGYALSRRSKVSLKVAHRSTNVDGATLRSDEGEYSLAWGYRFGRRLSSTLAYRHSREYAEITDSNLRENAVFLLLNYRF
jgi:uncharacterized protein (PEP-CTERM system associated)